MKKKTLICLAVFVFISCVATKATEVIYARAKISERHPQHQEILSRFPGGIWIGYILAFETIIAMGSEERFIIQRANFYYKTDNNFIFMGAVCELGVRDKNGNFLREMRLSENRLIGISSLLVEENSLSVRYILQEYGWTNYWESEVFAHLDIDIENATIKLRDRLRFFGP